MNSTHVIIFHDKSKKFINQATYNAIWNMSLSGNEKLKIGENLIAFSAISKILTNDEYYAQYPEENRKKQEQKALEYKNFDGLGIKGIINRTESASAIKQMIRGLKDYIASTPEKPVCPNGVDKRWYKGTNDPLEILEMMETKLRLVENNN